MAATFFDTYGGTGNAEDVRDLITVISPSNTPVYHTLGDSRANGTKHELN